MKTPCSHPDCGRDSRSLGLCSLHYNRQRSGSDRGPCECCGEPVISTDPGRRYCSLACWIASPERKAIDAERAVRMTKPKEERACEQCGGVMLIRPCDKGRNRRFCSRTCYRGHYAARFDRWVANPRAVETLVGFDEFLSQQELPCLFEGCGWSGKGLGSHANARHGITAAEFKSLCGFNRSTGLVSPSVRESLGRNAERMREGAKLRNAQGVPGAGRAAPPFRREHAEHHAKAMASRKAGKP